MFPILAFDNTDRCSSVCIKNSDGKLFHSSDSENKGIDGLLPQIDVLLEKAEIPLEDIATTCCSIGPGSFTGIRTGIAVAQGLGLALNSRVIGVPIMAARLVSQVEAPGTYHCYLIASKIDFFYASYSLDEAGVLNVLEEPRIVEASVVEENSDKWINLDISALKTDSSATALANLADNQGSFGLFDSKNPGDIGISPCYIKPVNAKTLKERNLS